MEDYDSTGKGTQIEMEIRNMKTKPITSFPVRGRGSPKLKALFKFHDILKGSPKQRGFFIDSQPRGTFVTGMWACTPGKYQVDRYHANCYESGYILEGKVRITDDKGNTKVYRAGDTIITPKGFKGTWEVLEPMRKVLVLHNC
jgi:uncharacterized cupin superfamily protein